MFCPKFFHFHLYNWAKGEGTSSFHRVFYFGSLHGFNFFLNFLWWANKIGSLQKKEKKVGLVRHPQLINMKPNNKYPKFMMGGIMSPKFCPCHYPGTKMVTDNFGNRYFIQLTRRLNMHMRWVQFFPFGGRVGWDFFFFFFPLVPNVFPTYSHHVS
jgi:hypothetical protein